MYMCVCGQQPNGVPASREDAGLVNALEQGNLPMVRNLCSQRNMNKGLVFRKLLRKPKFMTPFQYAAKEGLVEIMRELLDTGSVPEGVTCCEPWSPLSLACLYRNADCKPTMCMILDLLKHGAKVNEDTPSYMKPLVAAVCAQDTEVVQILCEHGADVNLTNALNGKVPLMDAAMIGDVDIVDTLCAHGADVNTVTIGGRSALLFAAEYGHVEAIRALCQHGANINKRGGRDRNTPLLQACLYAHDGAVTELIRNGADVDIGNVDGNSALFIAGSNILQRKHEQKIEIVKMLLRHPKISYDNRNYCGETALESLLGELDLYYNIEPHLNILELLINAGCSVPNMAHGKCPFSILHTFLLSMEIEANIDVSNMKKRPTIMPRFCNCFILLLSAGSQSRHLEQNCDMFPKTHAILEQRGILDYAQRCTGVASLMRLSKLTIRKHVQKPLTTHVPKIGLPCVLQKYVLLELPD